MGMAPVRKNRKCMYPVALPTCRTTRGNFTGTFKGGPLTMHHKKDVPVVDSFRRVLNVGAILVKFKLRDSTVRSPGRGFSLSVFHGKVRTIMRFRLGCWSVVGVGTTAVFGALAAIALSVALLVAKNYGGVRTGGRRAKGGATVRGVFTQGDIQACAHRPVRGRGISLLMGTTVTTPATMGGRP